MPFKSEFPPLDLDPCKLGILDYLYPPDREPSDSPVWIDARDVSHYHSPRSALSWAKRFGFGLQRLGVQAGDVCLLYTPNHIFMPVAYQGIIGLGAAFSGSNPAFTAKELEYQISVLQPKVLLVHPNLLATAKIAAAKAKLPENRLYLFSDRETPSIDGFKDWRTILGTAEEGETWQWRKLSREESQTRVAAINFSSGTTGLPKGVCLSHFNIVANSEQIKSFYDFSSTERWVGFLPLYHAYGQCYGMLIAPTMRIRMLIMGAFNFEEYLELVQEHKVKRMQTVPPIMIMLNKRPETSKYDLSSVKEMLCGAAPLSEGLQAAVSKKFNNVRITQGWGMTESTCAATGVPYWEQHRTGSVGMIMPNTEIKLLDDEGNEVPVGDRGEIHCRGPQISIGYWRNPAATRETFDAEGWLKSGDIATIDEDGHMRIVDRKKELIKVQSLQVAPAEVEAALLEHPDIADVGVCGITLQDNEWPRAYIALKEEAQGKISELEIQEWLEPRVSKHKRLIGGVAFVAEVPRLASGKIQRKVMKEWARRDAGQAKL